MPKHRGPKGPDHPNGDDGRRPTLKLVKGYHGADNDLLLGKVLGGKYRVEERIATSGMARTYRATSIKSGRSFALKLVRRDPMDDFDLHRSMRELCAASRLNPEHLVRIEDMGTHEGRPFFVSEFLEGTDMKNFLMGKPIPWTSVKGIILQVCRGLHTLHKNGLIHRNIKPSNIFMTDDGLVKLLDSGIAKSIDLRKSTVHTRPGLFIGVPLYCDPLQMEDGKKVDHRADIYSLGIVMYEMLCGELPFKGESVLDTLLMNKYEEPMPLRERRPDLDIPQSAEALVMRCLEKDPNGRFQSVDELREAILGS
jgi:serine/threonine-protein kinase